MKIFITGATGFIGKRLTQNLLSQGHEVIALVRQENIKKTENLFPEKSSIEWITGDLTSYDFGREILRNKNIQNVDSVIHVAANYQLGINHQDAYLTNVLGTQNILSLIKTFKKLNSFHYLSSYAVNPPGNRPIDEDDLITDYKSTDQYAQSKMQAEYLVRNTKLDNLKVRIYRPGIIIGDSKTGEMDKVDGPYYFFRFLQTLSDYRFFIPGGVFPLSCPKDSTLPLLPVDILSDWLTQMITNPTEHGLRSYHLIPHQNIKTKKFLEDVLKSYGLNLKVIRLPYSPFYQKILPYFKVPKEIYSYLQMNSNYKIDHFKNDFPHLTSPDYRIYLPKVLEKAREIVQ